MAQQKVYNFFFEEFLDPNDKKIHQIPVNSQTYEEAVVKAVEKYAEKLNETTGITGHLLLMV